MKCTSVRSDACLLILSVLGVVLPGCPVAPECRIDADCDDGLFCNGQEACVTGICQTGTNPCLDAPHCEEGADTCRECTADAECDVGDPCIVDACVDGECANVPVECPGEAFCYSETGDCIGCLTDADCSDGLFCNGAESCDRESNMCRPGAMPCLETICDEESDDCVECLVDEDCAQDERCANGVCMAIPECESDADCDDRSFCNGVETCVGGECQGAVPLCGQDEICDEETDSCEIAPSVKARQFLRTMLDQYHAEWFDVYEDVASAGNHFVHPAMMLGDLDPAGLLADDAWTEQPNTGATCIKYGFLGSGNDWGGFYRMHGVLQGEDVSPQPNWGIEPDAGIDLTGATRIEFWVRGEQGGEQVEFFALGVGRDPLTGEPIETYPDSSPKRSTGYITLTNEWQPHVISLENSDLSYVLGGFGWVTNALRNDDQDVVFYLDDIQYSLARPDTLRLLQSYAPRDNDVGSATLLRNLATTYDNALALIAFAAMGDLDSARMVADAFVYAQQNDRWFDDGRLRNGYQAGDLALPPGWEPHGRVGTARIPGWWGAEDDSSASWYEDAGFVGSKVGDLAWAIIALLNYRDAASLTGSDDDYLESAVALAEWIETNCRSSIEPGGYTGGYEGWEPAQDELTWKATEHNLDVYVAFSRLYQATRDQLWYSRAEAARTFVDAMWNTAGGHLWTGTAQDGQTINESVIPLDIQAWAVLAFEGQSPYEQGLEWAYEHCALDHNGYQGFDFDTDLDGVWFEGTAHMALAYAIVGHDDQASFYLGELRRAQEDDLYGDGLGLVATSKEDLTTGFGTTYIRRLHVGATSWMIFAELKHNPYWPAY